MPTTFEMGTQMCEIDAGAVRGLVLLGYVDEADQKVRDTVRGAFDAYCRDVEAFFTPEQLEDMGWDVIMGENSLCKISRMHELVFNLNADLTLAVDDAEPAQPVGCSLYTSSPFFVPLIISRLLRARGRARGLPQRHSHTTVLLPPPT